MTYVIFSVWVVATPADRPLVYRRRIHGQSVVPVAHCLISLFLWSWQCALLVENSAAYYSTQRFIQELATRPYPEAYESSPHPPTPFSKDLSSYFLPSTPRSSYWSDSFRICNQNFVRISALMPRPSHLPLFVHPNNIWHPPPHCAFFFLTLVMPSVVSKRLSFLEN